MNQHEHSHALETKGRVIKSAGIYDLFVNHIFGRRSRQMRVSALQEAGLKPKSSILDFGCGAGDLAFEAEKLISGQGTIFGIDPSEEMVKVARQKAAKRNSKVIFKVEAVENLSFPDETFDVVISSFVLHHLPDDLQINAFKELKRVLKPGGLFFAIDMKPSQSFASWLHRHAGSSDSNLKQVASKLSKLGFYQVEVRDAPVKDVVYVRGALGKP
jgi:ubiquinone/menaquinone biosynthesis C-methylase UbiE